MVLTVRDSLLNRPLVSGCGGSAAFLSLFLVSLVVGYIIQQSQIVTPMYLLVIQLLLFFIIKQPDRSTGEPLVTDLFNMVKIAGMWAGWYIGTFQH
jgi:hypothetical protein